MGTNGKMGTDPLFRPGVAVAVACNPAEKVVCPHFSGQVLGALKPRPTSPPTAWVGLEYHARESPFNSQSIIRLAPERPSGEALLDQCGHRIEHDPEEREHEQAGKYDG